MKKAPHIIFLDAGSVGLDIPWPDFSAFGKLTVWRHTEPMEILERIQDAEILLTNKVYLTKDHMNSAHGLKYIGTLSTGYNQVDIQAAAAKGIPVCNVPSYSTPSVMQHTIALILALSSQICLHTKAVQEGEWIGTRHFCFWKESPVELAGKTLGIVGFGDIGSSVARVAHHMGMRILAYNPRPKEAPGYEPFSFTSLEEVFSRSDVVSLHCPLTPENTGMVNASLIKSMKKNAILINCARGALINEPDLADALNKGIIAGAGLDVLAEEPMQPNTPLRHARNCLITPHTAWASVEARTRLMEVVWENVKAFMDGTPQNVVNGVRM